MNANATFRILIAVSYGMKYAAAGIIAEEMTDASDTILLKIKITSHAHSPTRSNFGHAPSKTPALVAIPLPPLKRRNTVQLCPTTAKNPSTDIN